MSQFIAGNDVFSDCREYHRPVEITFQAKKYIGDELYFISGGRKTISGLFSRRRYRYRETMKSYSNSIQLLCDHIYFQWQRRKERKLGI